MNAYAMETGSAAVVIGTVVDTDDPEGWGRVKVTYGFLGSEAKSNWAPIAAPMAGKERGVWFCPEVGDEAVLAFDRGDVWHPIVLGFMWNGVDLPPSTVTRERMIRTVNGHTIRFLDSTPQPDGNRGGIAIEDAHGNYIVMTNRKVTVRAAGILELDAAIIRLTSNGVSRTVTPNGNPI